MTTITSITRPLHRLRHREMLLAFAWGVARCLAVILVAFLIACLIDWWIDRRRDTPMALRIGLIVAQIIIAASVVCFWILRPLVRRRPDDELALFVEERHPHLKHRLISAVQFHRPKANLQWMSGELVDVVTGEAKHAVDRIDFPALADHRRLKWAAMAFGGIAVVVAMLLILMPQTLAALFGRQLLKANEIPRSVTITNRTAPIQPAAEPVTIQLAVTGPGLLTGDLRLETADGRAERIPIEQEPVDGLVTMTIPAPAGDFSFEAWIGDGRLKEPAHVRLIPRPAVTDVSASLILPPFVGTKPDGSRYEQAMPRGEIAGIEGCAARIIAKTQKPVTRASLELLGPSAEKSSVVVRSLPMKLTQPDSAAVSFDLKKEETSYRITVWDEFEFRNIDPPRRDVRLVPEEPPAVSLLPELFRPEGVSGSTEDFEVEGVPVPLGGAVRIGYTATHLYGLGRATLVYRINEGEWRRLPLDEAAGSESTGPFDPRRGSFVNSNVGDQVQFHAAPSADPMNRPGRLDGGGRFDFQTRALPGVKVGDTIEYFVEVSNRDPSQTLFGRSDMRAKRIVTVAELVNWIDSTLRQEDRIRRLTERQRGVFDNRPKE